jgi:hypothetical protein
MYLPAANSLGLSTNGTNAVYIDSSQNVGIGTTPSAWGSNYKALQIGGGSNGSFLNFATTNQLISFNAYYNGSNYVYQTNNYAGVYDFNGSAAGGYSWRLAASGTAGNTPSFTQAMTLDSSGNLLVGTTSSAALFTVVSSASANVAYVRNTNAAPYGIRLNYNNATPNGTDNWFIYADDSTTLRFRVTSNGGIYNYQANNVNLSDQREKKDIELAPNYLDKICQIPVKTFLFNDQTDTDLNLGAIAQDVQAVCPELVTESNWAGKDEPEKMRLSIYQTDLQYALMKSIQELKAINDTQAETINALTARIVALETI